MIYTAWIEWIRYFDYINNAPYIFVPISRKKCFCATRGGMRYLCSFYANKKNALRTIVWPYK